MEDGGGGGEEEEHRRFGEVEGGLAALCMNRPWVPHPRLQSSLPFFPLSASLPLFVSAAAPGLSRASFPSSSCLLAPWLPGLSALQSAFPRDDSLSLWSLQG